MQKITLIAPLSGMIYPIEEVPDPVFAQKMVGDGLSVDPTNHTLFAPIDGTVTQLHSAMHAVTLTHSSGLEVMMHIGIDTVVLKGKGFKAHIKAGQEVKQGDALIDFDLDFIATNAKSVLTQIIFTNGELIESIEKSDGMANANESPLATVTIKETLVCQNATVTQQKEESVLSDMLIIPNTTGFHARPAAVLAGLAKQYKSKITLLKNGESANAKSVVAIMGLDIRYKETIQLQAMGDDAKEAIAAIVPQIQSGLSDEGVTPIATAPQETKEPIKEPQKRKSDDPNLLIGVAASPGVAVGVAIQIKEERFDFAEEAEDAHEQKSRFERALEGAKNALESLEISLTKEANASKAAIFAAHREILDDPDLLDIANDLIDRGKSAEYSWNQAYTLYAKKLEGLQNKLLAERANDLRDVGKRVMRLLRGKEQASQTLPDNAILIAKEFTPSFVATIDTQKVKGFCITTGGATSHAAIIARSLDIPTIAGIEEQALDIIDGEPLILDGDKGTLRLHASQTLIDETIYKQQLITEERVKNLERAFEEALTTDGKKIEVVANIGELKDAVAGVKLGAEGVGLLRSEFLFLERTNEPSEEEQYVAYRDILLALEGRPLIVRTLDVGGDKPLPYLPMPSEENPFLGVRGIRIGFENQEIFRVQARAVLRASMYGKIRIMFPMISRVDEIREVKVMLEEEREKLGVAPIEVGIMVEVPSAAILADQFAKEVDFFSIGTNDLTQYTLAMDRGHPALALKIDALDPAVLRLIKLTADGAHKEGKWLGVCGGLASDPLAVPILVGLGIDELSVSVPSIPKIKAEVRKYSSNEAQTIASNALLCATAKDVRALLEKERR